MAAGAQVEANITLKSGQVHRLNLGSDGSRYVWDVSGSENAILSVFMPPATAWPTGTVPILTVEWCNVSDTVEWNAFASGAINIQTETSTPAIYLAGVVKYIAVRVSTVAGTDPTHAFAVVVAK